MSNPEHQTSSHRTDMSPPPLRPFEQARNDFEKNQLARVLRQEEFWKEVYVATIRSGKGTGDARDTADRAANALEQEFHAGLAHAEVTHIQHLKENEGSS